MKDFMANGRFSRGAEVIADASLSFVGNIDLSIQQIVNSSEYDLFQPLPPQFDLAVMDRFACYIPGWEMPKTSSEYLTGRYGFITDYLAEAFHYQFKHTNRYDEVNKRIRLGKSIEGRDEKGIKKTICAFLKILHPSGAPTDAEFEEYVSYATECRRRVKEQMNKRKPDDEFAMINLSYFKANGEEQVVYCPESKNAMATQHPVRRRIMLSDNDAEQPQSAPTIIEDQAVSKEGHSTIDIRPEEPAETHYTILYGDTGHSYESIVGPYLPGTTVVTVEDPYIRIPHQIQNFVRFCETVIKEGTIRKISLITSYDDNSQLADMHAKLDELKQSLLEIDVELDISLNPKIHDREIRFNNGWVIKIGRGLDFYQKPGGWYELGANDLSLRKCLETKVDIYRKKDK
jgi:ATP-dependent Lon protease